MNRKIAEIFRRHNVSMEPDKNMPWVCDKNSELTPLLDELSKFDILEVYNFFEYILYHRAEYVINECYDLEKKYPKGSSGFMPPGAVVIEKDWMISTRKNLIQIMNWYSTKLNLLHENEAQVSVSAIKSP